MLQLTVKTKGYCGGGYSDGGVGGDDGGGGIGGGGSKGIVVVVIVMLEDCSWVKKCQEFQVEGVHGRGRHGRKW